MLRLKIGSFEIELDSYGLLVTFCTISVLAGIIASIFSGK